MIKLLQKGDYQLLESKNQTKILILDNKQTFAWVNAKGIGEILIYSYKNHETDTVLSEGTYRLYDVINEPNLTDLVHLQLETGKNSWQSYLLLQGLPNIKNKRNRIIPTKELINKK